MNRIILKLILAAALTIPTAWAAPPPQTPAVPPNGEASLKDRCAAPTQQTPSREEEPPTANSLRVMTIEPSAGTRVQESTVLVAELSFTIKDFDSGNYLVFAQFDTTDPKKTTDGKFHSYPPLKYASGTYRLCYPVADIWNIPNVKRPLTVRFVLGKVDEARHIHSVALTDRVSFPTE